MGKVHILRWSNHNGISGIYAVYSDYEKACRIEKASNKNRPWYRRLFGDKWVVQTFVVKD